MLGPLFRTAGHAVRTQHGVTESAGQKSGDVELRSYLPGRRSLVFDLSMTHDRFGSSSHVCYFEKEEYGNFKDAQNTSSFAGDFSITTLSGAS